MIKPETDEILESLKQKKPLIHCITNPISINECADTVLAAGGRPIMAEHPMEVEEITQTAAAVLLNTGNITDARMKSITLCAKCCRENNIPFILDIVGVACSSLRKEYVKGLLAASTPDVIKGNYSELMALYGGYKAKGIDSEPLDITRLENICVSLARKYRTKILASGERDIATDGKRLFHICNGTPYLSNITGTGCMLGALCATLISEENSLDAVCYSAGIMGICGELAEKEKGHGSFKVSLFDKLSTITDKEIAEKLRMEEIKIGF